MRNFFAMNKLYILIETSLSKIILIIFLLFISNFSYGQVNDIEKKVSDKFASSNFSKATSVQELVKNITSLTSNKREQLQILLLWSYQNMHVDTNRFFNDGKSLTTS